jgi:hypothetical protein
MPKLTAFACYSLKWEKAKAAKQSDLMASCLGFAASPGVETWSCFSGVLRPRFVMPISRGWSVDHGTPYVTFPLTTLKIAAGKNRDESQKFPSIPRCPNGKSQDSRVDAIPSTIFDP